MNGWVIFKNLPFDTKIWGAIPVLFQNTYWKKLMEFFLNGAELSLNSVNSVNPGNLINH